MTAALQLSASSQLTEAPTSRPAPNYQPINHPALHPCTRHRCSPCYHAMSSINYLHSALFSVQDRSSHAMVESCAGNLQLSACLPPSASSSKVIAVWVSLYSRAGPDLPRARVEQVRVRQSVLTRQTWRATPARQDPSLASPQSEQTCAGRGPAVRHGAGDAAGGAGHLAPRQPAGDVRRGPVRHQARQSDLGLIEMIWNQFY